MHKIFYTLIIHLNDRKRDYSTKLVYHSYKDMYRQQITRKGLIESFQENYYLTGKIIKVFFFSEQKTFKMT